MIMLARAASEHTELPSHLPWLLLPGLGVISAAAMGCHMASSQLLPFGIFGMLSFVEPVLLSLMAIVFLGEKITFHAQLTFGPIWTAVVVIDVVIDAFGRKKTGALSRPSIVQAISPTS